MKRAIHSPWLVALAVLALATLPVLAALAAHREQARRAEALLFERSAEVVATQLQLVTSRQMAWQNGIRMRLSNRPDAPEKLMDDLFARGSWATLAENCRMLGYGALEDGKVVLRWRQTQSGPAPAALGDDLLARPETAALLRDAMARPAQLVSEQRGRTLLTAMTVAGASVHQPRGWLVAWWNLDGMCAHPQLRLIHADRTLTVRPLDNDPLPTERSVEVGEGEVHWRIAVGKGADFAALFPQVSERAIALTGGGCAVLLALLAGFAMRAAGLRAALAAERELVGMKDHLLHSVSHEFRTPLSVILSSAELLESYAERLAPERRTEAFTQIRDSTSRMSDMIEQVLLLSRIEARRLPSLAIWPAKLKPQPTDAAPSKSPHPTLST
jgi:signal transduction histidine kinase